MKRGWAVFGLLAFVMSSAAHAQPVRWQAEVETRLTELRSRADAELVDEAAAAALLSALDELLAAMAVHASPRDERLLVELARTRRVVQLAAEGHDAGSWYEYLSEPRGPGATLAFLVGPHDDPRRVLGVLAELRERFGDEPIARYDALVAALCVVHDGEELFTRRVNENTPRSPGPVALFDYYTTNEPRMLFGLRDVPAELHVFVVDAVGYISELEWALTQHQGDRAVGERFFDIAYDYEHARTGRPKAVTRKGYTLPNIAELGGVCADQCHYAVTVGKAIGVPTAYVTGRGGEVGHAWVGFLEARGRGAAWNFDVGRYDEYQGVRGVLLDPQTMQMIGDDELGLLARLTTVNQRQRHAAAAWLDAAETIRRGVHPAKLDNAPSSTKDEPPRERILELAERALRKNPADRRGWSIVRDAVADPQMPMQGRIRWSQIAIRLCEDAGAEHFMVHMVEPMISSMGDPKDRISAWERVLKHVRSKKDLRARIRLLQAADAIERGDKHGAYLAYADVFENTLNDTPQSRYAIAGAVRMLEQDGKHGQAAKLLADVLARVDRPVEAAAFTSSSNYAFVRTLASAYSAKHRVPIEGL